MTRKINLIGQQFDRLTVIKCAGKNRSGNYQWLCQCKCDKKVVISSYSLRIGKTRSCGCYRTDLLLQRTAKRKIPGITENGKQTKIYCIYDSMKQRCYNPNHHAYKNYGGRGIKVCDRWLEPNGQGFINFVKDMGERPPGTSIDRIDNNGDYCKENCRWVTRKQQMRNTRYNKLLTIDGITRCLIKWCEIYKLPYKKVYDRIYKLNWTPKEALEIIPRKKIK